MSVLTDNDDGTNKHISQLRHQLLEAIGYCFDWAEGETFTWGSEEFLGLFVKIGKTVEHGQEPDWKFEEIPALYYNNCTDEWSFLLRVSAESCWEEWQRMKRQEGEWRLA